MDTLEELDDAKIFDGVWSISTMQSILRCGKMFWYRKLQTEVVSQKTPALAFGSAVHAVLELVHKEANFHPGYWQQLWNEKWTEYANQVQWKYPSETMTRSGYDKLASTIIAGYIKLNSDVDLVSTEIAFPSEEFQPTIGRFPVRGKIDRVTRQANGKLLITDYKTSAKPPDPLLVRKEPQLTLYQEVGRQIYGEDVDVALYPLKGKLLLTERTPEDLENLLLMLEEAQLKFEQGRFDRNIDYHCKWCEFKEPCLQ